MCTGSLTLDIIGMRSLLFARLHNNSVRCTECGVQYNYDESERMWDWDDAQLWPILRKCLTISLMKSCFLFGDRI
jgi:hypothetical protein